MVRFKLDRLVIKSELNGYLVNVDVPLALAKFREIWPNTLLKLDPAICQDLRSKRLFLITDSLDNQTKAAFRKKPFDRYVDFVANTVYRWIKRRVNSKGWNYKNKLKLHTGGKI